MKKPYFISALFLVLAPLLFSAERPFEISGIYPHLTMFNDDGENGTGAVVPWGGRLWVITYGPHKPLGSSSRLYEITRDLRLVVRPESIGGTPANRMIHIESNQLFIGPYAISEKGDVRVIPYEAMVGRHTGNARHLGDPRNKIYYATMEEGFYEVDVHSLEVTELYEDLLFGADEHERDGPYAQLLGAHGKGLYSGQGRLVYSNNGERGSSEYFHNPFMTSGSLSEWDGKDWKTVSRAQFTEVTGPGGIYGNTDPDRDPIWAVGWDAKSLLLMSLDEGEWTQYRLPKSSHSYDGAHGWNTEWPRIREIGEDDLLMTMHGLFWRFPKTFSASNTKGIEPRSSYLKVIGDFARWGDKVVFGCDDTANREFLNTRPAKGELASPQSQSNLWFVDPDDLDDLGPAIGRGAVWLNEDLPSGSVSDAMLVAGFDDRGIHLAVDGYEDAVFDVEVDRTGKGDWKRLERITLGATDYRWLDMGDEEDVIWTRIRAKSALNNATVWFELSDRDQREAELPHAFDGLARAGDEISVGGLVHAMDKNARVLQFAAERGDGKERKRIGYYQLDSAMRLERVEAPRAFDWMQEHVAIPEREPRVIRTGPHSIVYSTANRQRYHLPKSQEAYDEPSAFGWGRLVREVATERDLFNAHGTFYELPAVNAGGMPKIRPIATHGLRIHDYCSYRGLLVLSGVSGYEELENPHLVKSDDGAAALWVGALDDLWEMGKPRGVGGPWFRTNVGAGENSDPYLIRGYDKKTLEIEVDASTTVVVQIDVSGDGDWVDYESYEFGEGRKSIDYRFPEGFQAYWIRFHSTQSAKITTTLGYE